MVFIISTLGPTDKYKDQEMLNKTFSIFLRSLENQTDKNFRLFLAYHDVPNIPFKLSFDMSWCSAGLGDDLIHTSVLKDFEKVNPFDVHNEDSRVIFEIKSFDCPMTDMSRKTIITAFDAVCFAIKNKIKDFWMLRMDSDDFLGKDIVEQINKTDPEEFQGIWNRKCHMMDVSTGEFGIAIHPYSTTTAAVHFKLDFENRQISPFWHFLAYNHTKLFSRMNEFKIKAKEIDWTMVISCNSGNHISGRPAIQQERFFEKLIPLTQELRDRYGL